MTVRSREQLIAREASALAPYAMRTADSRGRARAEVEHEYRPAGEPASGAAK